MSAEIAEMAKSRKINYLVHFTRIENLTSIADEKRGGVEE